MSPTVAGLIAGAVVVVLMLVGIYGVVLGSSIAHTGTEDR